MAEGAEFFIIQLTQDIEVLETWAIENYPHIDKFFALDPGYHADHGIFKQVLHGRVGLLL